jgi:hypothetical protein
VIGVADAVSKIQRDNGALHSFFDYVVSRVCGAILLENIDQGKAFRFLGVCISSSLIKSDEIVLPQRHENLLRHWSRVHHVEACEPCPTLLPQ